MFSHPRNHYFLLWLIKAGVYYVPAMPYQLLTVSYYYYFVSYILTIPYILSLILTIAIYAMPPSPLRPIEGVRGIHLLTTVILKRAGYVCVLRVSFMPRPRSLGPF